MSVAAEVWTDGCSPHANVSTILQARCSCGYLHPVDLSKLPSCCDSFEETYQFKTLDTSDVGTDERILSLQKQCSDFETQVQALELQLREREARIESLHVDYQTFSRLSCDLEAAQCILEDEREALAAAHRLLEDERKAKESLASEVHNLSQELESERQEHNDTQEVVSELMVKVQMLNKERGAIEQELRSLQDVSIIAQEVTESEVRLLQENRTLKANVEYLKGTLQAVQTLENEGSKSTWAKFAQLKLDTSPGFDKDMSTVTTSKSSLSLEKLDGAATTHADEGSANDHLRTDSVSSLSITIPYATHQTPTHVNTSQFLDTANDWSHIGVETTVEALQSTNNLNLSVSDRSSVLSDSDPNRDVQIKAQDLAKETQRLQDCMAQLETENRKLKATVESQQDDIVQLRVRITKRQDDEEGRDRIVAELDRSQAELDKLTEENSRSLEEKSVLHEELDATQLDLMRALASLKEAEGRIADLEDQSVVTPKEPNQLKVMNFQLRKQVADLCEEKEKLQEDLNALWDENDKAIQLREKEAKEWRTQHENDMAALNEARKFVEDLQAKSVGPSAELQEVRDKLSALERQNNALSEERDALNGLLQEEKETALQLRTEKSQYRLRAQALQEETEAIQEEMHRLHQTREASATETTLDAAEAQLRVEKYELEIEDLRIHISNLEQRLEEEIERNEGGEEAFAHMKRLQDDNAQLLEEQAHQDEMLEEMRLKCQRAEQSLREAKLSHDKLQAEYEGLVEDNQRLKEQLKEQVNAVDVIHKKQMQAMSASQVQLVKDNVALNERCKQAEAKSAELEASGSKLMASKKELDELKAQIAEEEAKRTEKEAGVHELDVEMEEALSGARAKLQEKEDEVATLRQHLVVVMKKVEDGERADRPESLRYKDELNAMAQTMQRLQLSLDQKEELIIELQKEKVSLIDDYKAMQSHSGFNSERQKEMSALQAKLADYHLKLDEMKKQYQEEVTKAQQEKTLEVNAIGRRLLVLKEDNQRLKLELEKKSLAAHEASIMDRQVPRSDMNGRSRPSQQSSAQDLKNSRTESEPGPHTAKNPRAQRTRAATATDLY